MSFLINWCAELKKIIFGYLTPPCVGVDIAATALKMVELYPNSLKIAKYSLEPVAKSLLSAGGIDDIEQLAEVIRKQWRNFDATYLEVAITIPHTAIILREVVAPIFRYKYQLDKFIHQQLLKELKNEDIDFDYLISKRSEQAQNIKLVVAKKEKIEEYQAIMQMSGLRVAAIEVEAFALQYLFVKLLRQQNTLQHTPLEQVILLDLGASRLRAFVFQNYQLMAFNEISVNYHQSSEAIVIQTVIGDIAKLMQLLSSTLLVERNINLNENIRAYLSGGNSMLPGVKNQLQNIYFKRLEYCSVFFAESNPHVPEADLLRLISAFALATWGQQID